MSNLPLAIALPNAAAAIAAVLWLASIIWRRKRLTRGEIALRMAGVTALTIFASGALSGLPSVEQALESIAGTLGTWTYLVVGVLAFLETGAFIGLVAPGEAAIIVGGVVAGQGEISITLLIAIVWFAAFMGDTVSFFVGRRLGREFLLKHGKRVHISESQLLQVERYMHEHGGKTILVGRFIGLVRALAPFIAGTSKMPYGRFAPYDIIGSGLWATAFCYLGYFFSQNLHEVIHYAERGVLLFGWTVGTIVVLVYLVRRFRKPEEREKLGLWLDQQEQHAFRASIIKPLRAFWRRLFLPVARFFSPQFKFAIGRFTPGGLGLEFTTASALLAVSSFGLFFFTDFATNGTNAEYLTRLNDAAFSIAAQLQSEWLTTLAKIVTQLGAFYVVAPIALVATGFCVWRRHVPEALVICFSLIITLVFVHLIKAWTDVPRPSGALIATEGSSYPSGHTAYAITYITIAVSLERIGGLFGRVVLVSVALAIGTAVALSRVYLRAHYLTDVLGGTALAVLCASTLSCLALVVVFLRSERRGRRIEREGKVIASGTQT